MTLDDLDRKIIRDLSSGISSYEELARICGVTRNTVYRRIAVLENKGIIKNTLRCIVNFELLNIKPILIGVRISQINLDKAVHRLAINKSVRFLWRTYGEYNLTLVAFCTEGREGKIIQEIETILEDFDADHECVSVGYVWEKMDDSPFGTPSEIAAKIIKSNKKQALIA